MKRQVFILGLLACSGSLWASGAGTSAAQILTLGPNPRAIALGEAQVGLADDVYATYWNPAGLAHLQTPETGFVHTEHVLGIRSEFAAYAHPTRLGVWAGHMQHLSIGSIDAYDAVGQRQGEVDAGASVFGASYARTLHHNRRMGSEVLVGTTGKWVRERLADARAQTFAGDAGVLYRPGRKGGEWTDGFSIGAVLRNAGAPMRYDETSSALPMSLTFGAAWTGVWLGEKLTLTADTEKTRAQIWRYGTGLELTTLRLLILRGGFTTRSDWGTGLRFGIGIRLRAFQLDYAYAGAGDFGTTHRLGMTLRLGIAPPDPLVLSQNAYEQGMKAYRQSRYTEALVHFNKSLEMDTSHAASLRMMKDTYEKLKTTAAP